MALKIDKNKLNKSAFWVLFLILVGICIGVFSSKIYFNSIQSNYIKMGRFVHNNIVYDITVSKIK